MFAEDASALRFGSASSACLLLERYTVLVTGDILRLAVEVDKAKVRLR